MKLFKVICPIVLLTSALSHAGEKTCPAPTPAQDGKFHAGQTWHYNARHGEEKSTLTVLKVESLPKGIIIHIRVDDIRLRNCTGGPEPDKFEHMPFTKEALDHSVTTLVRETREVPDFKVGYQEWRNACGGVYTISVADAIEVAETAFRQNLGCSSSVH